MKKIFYVVFLLFFIACENSNDEIIQVPDVIEVDTTAKNLTIFFVNDVHGQINNFAKIKHIVDAEKTANNVLLVCGGDIFSGNPVVDYYEDKGYPMIDLMNRVGFDVSAVGNHEFDYGEVTTNDRFEQAEFEWICANVDMNETGVENPLLYYTIEIDSLRVTFLGLIETYGKPGDIIPSTHPWRVQNFTFDWARNVVGDYAGLKDSENSDLYIALTHLGYYEGGSGFSDYHLANQFPYFDLIIGAHSHSTINTTVNNIPIFQAGSNLNYLGKVVLSIKNKKVKSYNFELINLNAYSEFDQEIQTLVDEYNSTPEFDEVIGSALSYQSKSEVGCFYADALRGKMNVDMTIQNSGGVRSDLDQGDITKREIYEIDPFNNGTVIYEITVGEIETFLKNSKDGFYYSGVTIEQGQDQIFIYDLNNDLISESTTLRLGINDYIPAVYDTYFPSNGAVQSLSSAETIISYLQEINSQIDYQECQHYFKYQ